MFRSLDFYRGVVVGLGIMYVLDPDHGRARRALIRDQVGRALRLTPGMQLLAGIVGAAALTLCATQIAARTRSRHEFEEDLDEMPEYAMLR